jgi:hypothetical protein
VPRRLDVHERILKATSRTAVGRSDVAGMA